MPRVNDATKNLELVDVRKFERLIPWVVRNHPQLAPWEPLEPLHKETVLYAQDINTVINQTRDAGVNEDGVAIE